MNQMSKQAETQENLKNSFRAYLQTAITAEQFGQRSSFAALPGAKTIDYCAALAKMSENNELARELAAPVWAILKEINDATMFFYRPLFQKVIEKPEKVAEYENILWQLDFALALILRRFSHLVRFRAKKTKCPDLLCDAICEMLRGAEPAKLISRWQAEFPEEGENNENPFEGSFPESFAWKTYESVQALDRLADEFPNHVKFAARRMHGWPMLVHRHTNNKKRFQQIATRFELGVEYPLDASEGARFRPNTPLVRYVDGWIFKLNYVWEMVKDETYKTVDEERKTLRSWLWEVQDEDPTDEQLGVALAIKQLPPLTKATANEWVEKVLVPLIMVTDAGDWKNCREPALQTIARQRGVKSRATFKSRLFAAVSATLRRLARTERSYVIEPMS
jgi:hypothetical protein